MDWNEVGMLFTVSKLAAEHGPKYAPIASAIQIELDQHVIGAQKIIDDKNKAAAEEAGRQKAEAANKAREDEEKGHVQIEAKAEAESEAESTPPSVDPPPVEPPSSDSSIRRI